MNAESHLNRRDFLQTATLAAAALPLVGLAAQTQGGPKGKPKVGCLSWCCHSFAPGVDPEEAIEIIGELGFDGIEMIATARRDLKDFWQLMDLHMRDIDGAMRQFPHFGQGVMDFKAIIDTLKQVGYSGFVSIEQDKHPGDMKETCRRYLQLRRECFG